MPQADITTDYLVVGAGFAGLGFVDELFKRTSATITIVDQRDAPGGHWTNSYPFVRLHQPAALYGVESSELTEYSIDQDGPNKGLSNLASGVEIQAYCQRLLRDKLLPSGRVTFLPSTKYESDGTLHQLISGKRLTVDVKKRLVDASWNTNSVPSTHTRSFKVDPSLTCIPPNDLPRLADKFNHYTILGAGKTATDACVWLITNGVDPNQIRWIFPNDLWYVNRAKVQPGLEFFEDVFGTFVNMRKEIGAAKDAMDLALRMEKIGLWLRLDKTITPKDFHTAVLSIRELEELRKIKDVVRKGRVTSIEPHQLTLTAGSLTASPDTLYVDCTASAIHMKPGVPVFQPGKIVIQIVRFPLIPLSGALIAYLESLSMTDEEKNHLAVPVPFCRTVEDYIATLYYDYLNRARTNKHPDLRKWISRSRLEGYGALAASVKPEQTEKFAILAQMKDANAAASANLDRLFASISQKTPSNNPRASL